MYYNSKELFEYKPEFYYGCKTKPRTIIQKKKIPESEYLFANLKMKEWKLSSQECKKAQLLISKEWVDKHYFKIELQPQPQLEERKGEDVLDEDNEEYIEEEQEEPNEDVEYENAPPLLELTDEEKFKDTNGNIIDIETRGEKHRNKIYFKVKNVSVAFGMDTLNKTIIDIRNGYKRNKHYKTFFIRSYGVENVSTTIKKCLYLTYRGLLRVLFVSYNKNAEHFQNWAEEKLFTIQMGSKEEKIKLGADILNISMKAYKAVFDSHADKFPSIYLFRLGKVRDLRETFQIPNLISDNSYVYKYGCTDDLSRRINETGQKYGKLQNVKPELVLYRMVETKHIFDAEREIREQCKAYEKNLNTSGYIELIILTGKEYEYMKKCYKRIGNEYAGASAELQRQVQELEQKVEQEHASHKYEMLEKDMVIKEKDMTIKEKDMENKELRTKIETDSKYNELLIQHLTLKGECNVKVRE
jgi:hypothetical protein